MQNKLQGQPEPYRLSNIRERGEGAMLYNMGVKQAIIIHTIPNHRDTSTI
jgi:hypothetical protein